MNNVPTTQNKASIFRPGEGDILDLNGGTITFKVTSSISNNQLGVYEITLSPKTVGAELHYHREMDETFIVNKGILTIQMSDEILEAEAGTVVYVPRLTPHSFKNNSDEDVTLTLIFNPTMGREGFFTGLKEILSEQPVDPEKFLKLYNDYDSYPSDAASMVPHKI
ncbi:MAG: cupin domain-containing protein [Chitinophagaceae bacterium]|nr:cupin domain-containing protein [Chitinophagaceae bacterium]